MFDFIKRSIIEIARLQFGAVNQDDYAQPNEESTKNLEAFVSDKNIMILYSYLEPNGILKFSKRVLEGRENGKAIIFSKSSPLCSENEDFLKLLHINTVSGSPNVDLYEFLNKIFSRCLNKDYDTTIQKKVNVLQSALKTVILTENSNRAIGQLDESFLEFSNSMEDEIKYWEIISSTESTKKRSSAFIKLLQPIAKDLSIVESLPFNEVEEMLERCHNTLDDLWRSIPPYPKERIIHLMNIIGDELWKYTVNQFKDCNVWNEEYNKVLELLHQCSAIGEKWLMTCQQLTGLFWPNYSTNPWGQEVYQPPELLQRVSLLKKVISIRTIHKQLLRLSTPEEQDDLRNEKIFRPFKDINLISYDDDSSHEVLKAEKQFEYLLQPAEEQVALKFKKQLIQVNANTRQLIYEFTRYSELISRPVLKKTLYPERQFLLNALHEYVTQIQNQSNLEVSRISVKQEASETITEIIVLRQLEAKADEVIFITKKILNDLDGYENILDFAVSVKNDLKTQHNELFDSWNFGITADINNSTLSLKEADRVIQFYKDKLLKVNYPAKLLTLISEVRQLKAMGYHIPSLIQETTVHAQKFLKYARTLEQIANFHNTIGDRMIPCQKPMMLSSALELSQLVQEQEVVSWSEEKSVKKYVDTLKKTVEKLSSSNNLLASCHIEIINKIKELEHANLIKEIGRWNETIHNIKNIISNVENKGFKNLQSWKIEIDTKICEVLEKEYIRNLKSLHLGLEEISVDLVYRNLKLDFSPNKQTLEQIYDQQIKKYLHIPKTFKGISNMPENIYSKIIERNQDAIEDISKERENLFIQLDSVRNHWQSWLQLDHLDTKKLTSWQHWDLLFRASKTFGQEIAKLPSAEEKVGCFTIGLSRLRSDLESHNRSYWDQLVFSLKDSIAEDIVNLQNYVDPSTAALTKQPVTLDEIGETGLNYTNITNTHSEMEVTYKEMLQKYQTLASWSREQVDSVNRLKGAWERLCSLMNNHQHIMAKQLETIRTSLNIEKENLLKETERFEAKWNQNNTNYDPLKINNSTIDEIYKLFEAVKIKRSELNEVLKKRNQLIENYNKFNMDVPDIVIITEIENALNDEESAWSILEEFNTEFKTITQEYWIVFRKKLYDLDDFFKKWEARFKLNDKPFVTVVLEDFKKYKNVVPLLKYVKGEDFIEKHWNDLFNVLNIKPKPIDELRLLDFLDKSEDLQTHAKYLQDLNKKAASEIVIRQTIKDIDQWGIQCKFLLYSHTDHSGKDIMLIKEFKEVINEISDHQILLQSLKNSAILDGFVEATNNWENKLEALNEYINLLAQIQKKWLYLEPIFDRGTIPQEKAKFNRLDRDFRKMMSYVSNNTRVSELSNYPNLKSTSVNILEQLARCQHSLNNFLKEKRESFPRFLFLNDDDLLEIIGQSTKEQVIQAQLKKLFAGINSVKLNASGENIVAICSVQGEVVQLENSVDIKGPIEEWLKHLVLEMQSTLKELLLQCQRENQAPDPLKYPSQILCLSNNVWFTINCEKAITGMSLPSLLAKYKAQLSELGSMELNSTGTSYNKTNENTVLELKHKALLLDTIHHIGILQELLNKNVSNLSNWIWQKQLRYYTNSRGDITIKMAKANMEYSYEYLGNDQQLVRTPLVEQCFLTLTQAMHLGLGGNPYGPAGTGKTESVKALGSILGRQVLVFNCDEGIDANSMERILIGLVKTGAWGCFDEFNRLDETTLSAISMIIHSIQEALKNNLNVTKLANQEVAINKHCGVFVTLNPAGGGYGGRNKLPDNLKQLFRPVVMTHPDHEEIARTYLHCDGYQHANTLAKKIVAVFNMSSKLMSKQRHYDWGLRAIKTVLASCQSAIKEFNKSRNESIKLSMHDEFAIVVNTLKMDIISKLTILDTIKFNDIISNVFKDISTENMEDEKFKQAILESYKDLNLIAADRQVNKCLEFYKQLKQRMGVAVIGPPTSGKSTIIEIVSKALIKIHQKIKIYSVNPKCMPRKLLLGYTDHLNQWNDGVLTNYSLQVAAESKDVWSWIICDGDIDPEWVESLNSVLDDNRLMTLPSGWRIHFGQNVNFVFETHDVKHASPATISRIGIVYLGPEDVTLSDFLTKQLNNLSDERRTYLEPLLSEYLPTVLSWIMKNGEITLNRSQISVARTGFLQVLDVKSKLHFIVALVNGLGQQLKQEFRELFAQQVFELAEEPVPSIVERMYYDQENDTIDIYHTNPNIEIDSIENGIPLIKTGQVLKYLDVLKVFLKEQSEEHFLLVGPHGSGKRLMIHYLLSQRSDTEIVTINCSPNIETNFIIHQIQQHCLSVNTFQGNILKPRRGYIVLYLRNLHLLKPDIWGSNKTIEFLRQLIENKGFFDPKADFVRIENILIIGTMIPSNKISSRFLSKLHLVNIDLPDKEELTVITVGYLSAVLKTNFSFLNFTKTKVVKLASTMIYLLEKAKIMFASLHHYHIPTPHDLIQWCTNIKYYSLSDTEEPDLRLLEVVCYECLRIFTDKLVTVEDKKKFSIVINDAFRDNFDRNRLIEAVTHVYYVSSDKSLVKAPTFKKSLKESWQSLVEDGVAQYGKEHQDFNIVINEEILLLTAAIMRVIAIPAYNMVLIGKAGVGRKTSIKIVSAMLSVQIIHPLSGKYPVFYNDLKSAVQHSGVEGEDVFLILEDHVFSTEQNSNLINLIMTSGEVSDLFTNVEMESFVKGLKEKSDEQNFDGDHIRFFAENIKKKLHIFVILDQDNVNLRSMFLNCPAFSQNSGLFWLNKWNDTTIQLFPQGLISQLNGLEDSECSSGFNYIYKSLPNAVPSRYISMVKLYYSMYNEKKMSIKSNISQLKGGVSKLTAAKNLVGDLKQKAAEQQQKLGEKQAKANGALDMISNTIKGANTHKEEMEVLKGKTEEENVQLVRRKAEIEQELAEVEPLIKDASAAVENIKTESLSEIRSLRAPPEIIRDILEGVLKLMGTQDTSWNSMKIFLAKRGVKEEIRSFDASRIQTENRQAVEKLISLKKESFDLKNAKRASVAAAPLAAWVEANVKYSKVLAKIRPLEKEQHKLKQNLVDAETQLMELKGSLSDVDTTVAQLKEQLSIYTKEAAELEINLKQVQQTLTSAESLVTKLEDEYQRWQEQLKEFSKELTLLPNNCLLAAAIMTFLSEEPENKRRDMIKRWCTDLNLPDFDFILFLSTEREQVHWEAEGLPNNKISFENSIVIKQGILTPLLIDPTSTAASWLKEHYSQRGKVFEHTNYSSFKFNTMLEASLRFGKTLLVEEIEEAFHTVLPILREEFIYRGERRMISILGRKIDCHLDFKLILCTRNEHCRLPAEVAPFVSVLNFNVTLSGFTEQLLSSSVAQENAELESRKKNLLKENEELQDKLQTLQNALLECLVTSDENILNDKKLFTTLNDTKTSFIAISSALSETRKIQNELRKEYEVFLTISSFGSKLYVACREFVKYNILYSLSADSYKKLFLQCIRAIKVDDATMERQLFHTVYNYMSRGMFKSDRLPFFFHLVYRLFPKEIPENEMNIFFYNGAYPKNENPDSADMPNWLPPMALQRIYFLKDSLPDLIVKTELKERNKWSSFMESLQCEKDFPSFCKLSEFQKLLIIQALRPDRLLIAIEHCVLRISGLQSIEPPVLSLQHTFKESSAKEPILLITTPGMDPSTEIRDLAKELKIQYKEVLRRCLQAVRYCGLILFDTKFMLHKLSNKNAKQYFFKFQSDEGQEFLIYVIFGELHSKRYGISMGERQEENALISLEECKKDDQWLILKNLQLVTNWLPVLFHSVNNSNSSLRFRLWLISTSTQNFNIVLAQNCLKIAYEEPQGVGNNIQRIYASQGDNYANQSRTSARIFFVFSCVHALLQERRNYIPQGWTKYYEFNHTDIQTCLLLTKDLWNVDTTRVQWDYIKGLVNEAVYSGRIENVYDRRILDTYLGIYFKDEVLSYKWKPLGLNSNLPDATENKEYMKIIKQFPTKDRPFMFGLPENIDKARGKQISEILISRLKDLYQLKNIEVFSQDTNRRNISHYISLWKNFNEGLDFIKLTILHEESENSATARFIQEEYVLGINLIQDIHKCFTYLKKLVKGMLEPDDDNIGVASSISQHKTPQTWLDIWNGPEDLTQFLQELLQKANYISNWKMKQDVMIKEPVKLSLFFYPTAFLASLKQDYGRSSSISLDNLVLGTSWSNFNHTGIVLSDLLIEGGLFENKNIVPCKSDSENINPVPNCHLYWTTKEKMDHAEIFKFPLYTDSRRQCKITGLQMECNDNTKDEWILRGIAFYLKY